MTDHPQTQTSDNRFMLAAGAMMVLIVALLAGLAVKYHRRAVRAETELSQLKPAVNRPAIVNLVDEVQAGDEEVLLVEFKDIDSPEELAEFVRGPKGILLQAAQQR